MQELDKCLLLRQRLNELEEKISYLKLKNTFAPISVISDMPRFSGVSSSIEDYIVKIEELKEKRESIQLQLAQQRKTIEMIMNILHISEEAQNMILLRFYYGFQWKKCSQKQQEKFPDSGWNINKCFRVYHNILNKDRATKR